VFTARYALSPYIKQIRFVFKGLVLVESNVEWKRYSKTSVKMVENKCFCEWKVRKYETVWDEQYNQFPVANWGRRWRINGTWIGSTATPRQRYTGYSASRISRKSGFSIHVVSSICVAYIKGNAVETQTPTHLINRSMTALTPVLSPSSILHPPPSDWSFIRARRKSVHISEMLCHFFLLFEILLVSKLRNLNCVIRGLSVVRCPVQSEAELVFLLFVAGLKTKTEEMKYLLFQASVPLIWPCFHLIFITSIIVVEVLSCLVSRISRRWTVVTWWWALCCLEFGPLFTLQFLLLLHGGHGCSSSTHIINSFMN
jgi:hypothetical protein